MENCQVSIIKGHTSKNIEFKRHFTKQISLEKTHLLNYDNISLQFFIIILFNYSILFNNFIDIKYNIFIYNTFIHMIYLYIRYFCIWSSYI